MAGEQTNSLDSAIDHEQALRDAALTAYSDE